MDPLDLVELMELVDLIDIEVFFWRSAQRCVLPVSFPVNPPEKKLEKRTSVQWDLPVLVSLTQLSKF